MSALLGYPNEPSNGSPNGSPEGTPLNSGQMYPDAVAGLYGFAALTTALMHRQRTGKGQFIDLSMQEANFTFIGDAWLEYILNDNVRTRLGNRHMTFAPHGIFPTQEEDWWIAIDEVNNGGGDGILYLFYDPTQTLFDLSSTLPSMQILHLPVNCRNTRQISELCSQILGLVSGEEIKVLRDTPAGEECEHRVIKESGKRFRQLESWVQEWVKKDNIQPRQIAILSPYRQDNTIMANLRVIARVPLVSSVDEWNRNEGILVATIRSFKGLEADIVVLIDAPPVNEKPVFQTSDYYVAVSRAKHLLKVLVPKKLL